MSPQNHVTMKMARKQNLERGGSWERAGNGRDFQRPTAYTDQKSGEKGGKGPYLETGGGWSLVEEGT